MISIPKKKINTHLNIVFKKIDLLKKDCDVLNRWARMSKIKSAKRLSVIFTDVLENLNTDLIDLESILKEPAKFQKTR